MDKKIKVLISYQGMMIGGSTTSLLSILERLDYTRFDIDLLLDTVSGELLHLVPDKVNILPSAYRFPNHTLRNLINLFSPRYLIAHYKALKIAKSSGSRLQGIQYRETADVERYRSFKQHYDIAIAFLEGRNCKFVANHINASKKIAWIHIDYKASEFNPKYDIESLSKFDRIITVSESCKKSFNDCFPSLSNRTEVIENILSSDLLTKRADELIELDLNQEKIKLVTCCRICFASKGLDRAVRAMSKIKNLKNFNRIKWYIIGDGPDFLTLQKLVQAYGLEENIELLGPKINPYPYLKQMDVFFLPSVWEGKPMAVTEALLLGLPVMVTQYLSAPEQIQNGKDGIILENSEDGITIGLTRILENPDIITFLKQNVMSSSYSNDEEMNKINSLLSI